MAHNLNFTNGKASMFYVGKKPWHGLGTELQSPATAREAVEVAQLDYGVEKQPLYLKNGNEVGIKVATVRQDTQKVLGVVTDSYTIVQNTEAFSFFDSVVQEGAAMYQTAGALGNGERIWIMAKLPGDIIVTKDDVVEKYLLLMNSHDGSSALKMYYTPIRVVCQNTLTASYRDASEGISIRHMGNIQSKVREAQKLLGLAVNYYAKLSDDFRALANYKMTDKELDSYFDYVLKGGKIKLNEAEESAKFRNDKNRLLRLSYSGMGNSSSEVKGTAWAAYNAVTEFADFHKTMRGIEENPTQRLKNIWVGNSAKMKSLALDKALELVTV